MNMSYCRFENTLSDLRDCARYIRTPISQEEAVARRKLIEECYDILQTYCLVDSEGELETEMIAELPVEDEDEDDSA